MKTKDISFKSNLNNFILWCKNWYVLTPKVEKLANNDTDKYLLETMKRVLYLDDYQFVSSQNEVVQILLNHLDDYNRWAHENNGRVFKSAELARSIWEKITNYNLLDNEPKLSYFAALIFAMREFFGWKVDTDKLVLVSPHYDRKLYKLGLESPKARYLNVQGLTYKTLNDNLKKYNWFNNLED